MIDEAWLREAADVEEAAALTAQLVAIRSYPGEEGAVQRAVAAWLSDHGLRPEFQATVDDRPNVIARVENGPAPTLLFNGHTDTVLAVDGWDGDPWQGWRDGDKLYGLGACDMKSGVAAAMLATRALASRPDLWRGTLIFTAVVDEEAYSVGAHALIDAGITADACVVTESSWAMPSLGGPGKVLVRMDVTGKATHATWPEGGINAAVEAARFVARLHEVPPTTHPRIAASQSVLSFHSGSEQYVITVPEHARVLINRHLVPGEKGEHVLAQMRALAASLDSPARFDFTIDPPYYPPWETDVDHPLTDCLARAYEAEAGHPPRFGYRMFGDANLFSAEAGIPTVQIGPDGGAFHEADEWVSIASIAATTRVLLRLATDLLAP
ncbi:MAG: M20/M25/M40 family metallo-hydrolase [Chloroflexota bacterium]|nr:M20/M25/M40 family metallo-hydrolase [Chloroflexota bacterium]